MNEALPLKWNYCVSDSVVYKNFIYEAHMTITSGDCGGLLFRTLEQQDDTYQFQVCQEGGYDLYYYNVQGAPRFFTPPKCPPAPNGSQSSCALAYNTAVAIKHGLGKSNVLAVEANGKTITLWVNHVLLTSVQDPKFADGHIGFFANDLHSPTTVVFSNLRVWKL